jgi:hypothetical protein
MDYERRMCIGSGFAGRSVGARSSERADPALQLALIVAAANRVDGMTEVDRRNAEEGVIVL